MPDEPVTLRNLFLGVGADEWERATVDDLPVSPMYGELTVEDVFAGLAAMLHRLDEETGRHGRVRRGPFQD